MFGSVVLELALGVVFVFLLVSLLVSAATELIASFMRWRATNLWKALRAMLGEGVQEQLYQHPLIKTLITPATESPWGTRWLLKLPGFRCLWPETKGPSYIPSRAFAFALLDLMENPYQTLEHGRAAVDAALNDPARIGRAIDAVKAMAAFQAAAAAAPRLQSLADELGTAAPPDRARAILSQLRAEIAALQNNPSLFDADVQKALRPFLKAAGDNIDRLRTDVETWFNDVMDRTSGWYKRKVQAVNLVLALLLALALDVDTVLIAKVLWRDGALRASIVAQAEAAAAKPPSGVGDGTAASDSAQVRFESVQRQLSALSLPVRGSCVAIEGRSQPWWCGELARGATSYVVPVVNVPMYIQRNPLRWLGWLFTALAASLGAPFWFDVLKKIMSVRASGRAPEERPTSPKEVPQPAKPGA